MRGPWGLLALALLLPLACASPAPSEGARAALEGDFTFAAPRIGDAGAYNRSLVRLDGGLATVLEAPALRESFRIEATPIQNDGQGRHAGGYGVRTWLAGDPHESRWSVQASDGRPYARTGYVEGQDATEEGLAAWVTEATHWEEDPQGMLCGLAKAAREETVPLGQSLVLFPQPCRRAHWAVEDYGHTLMTPVRQDPFGDATAVGFQQVGTEQGPTAGLLLVWFAPDIPYPIRFLEKVEGTTFAVLDLVAFTRGPAPFVPPAGPPLPPVLDVPATREGPVTRAPQADWPWAEAFAAAKDQDAGIAAFMDSPAAYVRSAVFNDFAVHRDLPTGSSEGHRYRWNVVLDDGASALSCSVDREVMENSAPVAGVLALPLPPTDQVETGCQPAPAQRATASDLADRMPDPEAALAWWDAMASPDFARGPGRLAGFGFPCLEECPPHPEVMVGWLHGESWVNGTTDVNAPAEGTWSASYLVVSAANGPAFVQNRNDLVLGRPVGLAPLIPEPIRTPLAMILHEVLEAGPAPAIGPAAESLGLPVAPPAGGSAPADPAGGAPGAGLRAALPAAGFGWAAPAAVAGGAAALGAGLWGLKLLAGALFSRLRKGRALDHPVRQALMDLVEADPGVHLQELARRSGQSMGNVRHHVGKLAEAGLIERVQEGGYCAVFPQGPRRAAGPRSDGARRVLAAVHAEPGLSPAQLARRVGLAPGTVDHHVARLAGSGRLRVVKLNGGVRLHPF